MQKIRIYKVTITKSYMADEQGVGYSLRPWGNDTDYYQGYDDGGQWYNLPERYSVKPSNAGLIEIYGAEEFQPMGTVELCDCESGPAILTADGTVIPLLPAQN